ncbi:MAG: class I SAM-dependent methyltransferase [Leptospirales bacterium]|jgi:predicted SAM-dependent methyltransferase
MTEFDYTGKENLDAMALAVRYNNTIYRWLRRGLAANDSILEFGAGKGEYCNRFADHTIQAIELDQEMHPSIACPAFQDIDQADGQFNLIYAVNVLEHIKDDAESVRQFHARLRPGGRVKIFVPARMELYSSMDTLVGHERRYHPSGLKNLFQENGFRMLDCRYFDFLGYFATLAYKISRGKGEVSPASIRVYDSLIFPVSTALDFLTRGRVIGKNLIFEAIRID